MKKILTNILRLIFVSLLLVSCNLSNRDAKPPSKTVDFVESKGVTTYKTIDKEKLGLTYWNRFDFNTEITTYEVEVKKISGKEHGLFGLTFDYTDKSNLKYFIIQTNGEYAIGEIINNNWRNLTTWTPSISIVKGNSVSNNLKVVFDGVKYLYYINDQLITSHNLTVFTNNSNRKSYGYIAQMELDEAFPETPVEVQFKVKTIN